MVATRRKQGSQDEPSAPPRRMSMTTGIPRPIVKRRQSEFQSASSTREVASPPPAQEPESKEAAPIKHRRKTIHHDLKRDDDLTFSIVAEKETTNPTAPIRKSNPISLKGVPNPNEDLIKKVAFLRVCVNYMLMNLNKQPFSYTGKITLPWLMKEYEKQKNKL